MTSPASAVALLTALEQELQRHVQFNDEQIAALQGDEFLPFHRGARQAFETARKRVDAVLAQLAAPAEAPAPQPFDVEELHRLAQNCRDWGVSVEFTCHEMQQGREYMGLAWLESVGILIRDSGQALMLKLHGYQEGVPDPPSHTSQRSDP